MLRTLLVFSFVLNLCYVVEAQSQGSNNKNVYEYVPQLNGCLKLHQQPFSWLDAWGTCLYEGAQLTSPWSQKFMSAVNELQNRYGQLLPVLYSGVHATLPPFDGGDLQSMKKDVERCGVWYATGGTGEVDCEELLPFVCYASVSKPTVTSAPVPKYKPAPVPTCTPASKAAVTSAPIPLPDSAATPISLPPVLATIVTSSPALTSSSESAPIFTTDVKCGNRMQGYELDNRTRRCYKFHIQPWHWREANRACQDEGARLAVPSSREETQVLTALFERYPDAEIRGHFQFTSNYIAVGIYWDGSSAWQTVHGPSLKEVRYAELTPPADQSPSSFPYVFMRRDGKLVAQDFRAPFICVKETIF